jgi:hypothetical protein
MSTAVCTATDAQSAPPTTNNASMRSPPTC